MGSKMKNPDYRAWVCGAAGSDRTQYEYAERIQRHREDTHRVAMQLARRSFELDSKQAAPLELLEFAP